MSHTRTNEVARNTKPIKNTATNWTNNIVQLWRYRIMARSRCPHDKNWFVDV